MELYTLNSEFYRTSIVDEFTSLIWVEKYGAAGEVSLVTPATPDAMIRFAPGTFLSLGDSDEVMILETQEIDDNGVLTVSGGSLLGFLAHRVIRTTFPVPGLPHNKIWLFWNVKAGVIMTTIVQEMCISGDYIDDAWLYGLDGPNEKIPNLSIGASDASGPDLTVQVPFGPVYDALREIHEKYKVGMKLYLDNADEDGYSLVFSSYVGQDRTSSQTENPVIRLSPALDSLGKTKELHSSAGYKNVAYTFAPGVEDMGVFYGTAFEGGVSGDLIGFNRRTIMVFCDDITNDTVSNSDAVLEDLLNQRAADALANNNYIKLLDGEVIPHDDFQFGVHYGLGDIIELESNSGLVQNVRVMEYIRSKDESGERSYPTVSIVNE